MLPLLDSEWFRLRRRGLPWILLGVFLGVIGLLYLLMWFVLGSDSSTPTGEFAQAQLRQSLRVAGVPTSGMQHVGMFGSVFVVILVSSMIATEFTWGTIRTLLPRASGRVPFLTAKLLITVAFAAVVVASGYLLSLVATAIITRVEGLDSSVGSGFWLDSLTGIGGALLVMLPYAALAAMVSLLTRSGAAAIGITLGVMFLEPVIMSIVSQGGDPLSRLPELFLATNVNAVTGAQEAPGGAGAIFGEPTDLPNPWQSAAVLAAYTAAFAGISYWHFAKNDVRTT